MTDKLFEKKNNNYQISIPEYNNNSKKLEVDYQFNHHTLTLTDVDEVTYSITFDDPLVQQITDGQLKIIFFEDVLLDLLENNCVAGGNKLSSIKTGSHMIKLIISTRTGLEMKFDLKNFNSQLLDKVNSLEQQVIDLNKQVVSLNEMVYNMQHSQVEVLCLTLVDLIVIENMYKWKVRTVTTGCSSMVLSDDGLKVEIRRGGMYRLDVSMLNNTTSFSIGLFKNGTGIFYGYGCTGWYSDAQINFVEKCSAGDIISVNAHTGTIYSSCHYPYHFSFMKTRYP